jgi:hypothetical protein
MKKLVLLLLAFALPHFSWAQLLLFNATLSGLQENPANASPGTGTATASFNLGTNLFVFNDSWSGLSAPQTASHIHTPGAPGVNGPVVFPFGAAEGFVPGGTSGSVSFSTILTATQITQLLGGLFYVNVHTTAFPGGEIRGQITAIPSAVPEPSTYALAGAALLGLMIWRRVRVHCHAA